MNDELDSKAVAAILGIGQRSVLYAAIRGDLRGTATQRGKKRYWHFLRADVDAYMQSIHGQSEGQSSTS